MALEKRHPDSIKVENEAAYLAVLAGDQESEKKYFDQTGGQIDPVCWYSTNAYLYYAAQVYGGGAQK